MNTSISTRPICLSVHKSFTGPSAASLLISESTVVPSVLLTATNLRSSGLDPILISSDLDYSLRSLQMGVAGTKHALNNGYGEHFEQDDLMTSSERGGGELNGSVDNYDASVAMHACSHAQAMSTGGGGSGDVCGGKSCTADTAACCNVGNSEMSASDNNTHMKTISSSSALATSSSSDLLPTSVSSSPAFNGLQQSRAAAVSEEVRQLHADWLELRRCVRQFYWLYMGPVVHALGVAAGARGKVEEVEEERRRCSRAAAKLQTIVQQKAERLCVRDAHQLFLRLNGQLLELTGEVRLQLLGQFDAETSASSPSACKPRDFLQNLVCYRECMLEAADALAGALAPLQSHMDSFGMSWRTLNDYAYCSVVYMEPILQNILLEIMAELSYEQQKSPTSESTTSQPITTKDTTTDITTTTKTAAATSSTETTTSSMRRAVDEDLMERYMDMVTDLVESADQWRCAEFQLQKMGRDSGSRPGPLFHSEREYNELVKLYYASGLDVKFETSGAALTLPAITGPASDSVAASIKDGVTIHAKKHSQPTVSPATTPVSASAITTKTAAAAVAATADSRTRLQPTPLPPPLAQQFKASRQQQQQQQQSCRSVCNSRACCTKRAPPGSTTTADGDVTASSVNCCSTASSSAVAVGSPSATGSVCDGGGGESVSSCRRRRQKHGPPARSASRGPVEGQHCSSASCCAGAADAAGACEAPAASRDDTDTCSERSSSQHCCCCCCCELFGHEAAAAAAAAAAVSSQSQPAGRNYPEIRDRLRLRLDQRRKREESAAAAAVQRSSCSPVSSSADRSSQSDQQVAGTAAAVNRDDRDLSDLVSYIEASGTAAAAVRTNQKRAAKRERQRQKRLEQQSCSQLQQLQLRSLEEFQRRNPEVTITVVGGEQTVSQQQQQQVPRKSLSPVAVVSSGGGGRGVVTLAPSTTTTTSTTRRGSSSSGGPPATTGSPLLDSMAASGAVPSGAESGQADGDARMVTIRRVMEPGGSGEPKVTITLKGDKPEEDRLLMTLVNGQMRESDSAQSQGALSEAAMTKTAKKKLKKSLKLQKLREEEEAAERARLAEEEAAAKLAQEKLNLEQQQQKKNKNKKKNKKPDTQSKSAVNGNSNNNVYMTSKGVNSDMPNASARSSGPSSLINNSTTVGADRKPANGLNGHVSSGPSVAKNCSFEPPCQLLQDLTLSSDSEIEEIARTYRIPAGISISRVVPGSQCEVPAAGGAGNGPAPARVVPGANLVAPPSTVVVGAANGTHSTCYPVRLGNGSAASPANAAGAAGGGDDKKAKKKRRKKKVGAQLASSSAAEMCLAPEVTIRKVEPCSARSVDDYESVFMPLSSSSGLTDSVDQEVEAFKRFCLDSPQVNREQRPKVNLNIKDIFIKMRPTQ